MEGSGLSPTIFLNDGVINQTFIHNQYMIERVGRSPSQSHLLGTGTESRNYGAISHLQETKASTSETRQAVTDVSSHITSYYNENRELLGPLDAHTANRGFITGISPNERHNEEKKTIDILNRPCHYGATSSSAPEREDFSRPVEWDRPSVEEAQSFYETESQKSSLDPRLKNRYKRLADDLTMTLKLEDSLHQVVEEKRGDAADAYRHSYFNLKQAVDLLQQAKNKEITPADCNRYDLLKDIARKYTDAGFSFAQVADLAKTHHITGDLKITLRGNDNNKEYNLSLFDFKQPGSIKNYYEIINQRFSSGSNLDTIKQQKELIEAAFQKLKEVHNTSAWPMFSFI
jgi:hypothetical protein